MEPDSESDFSRDMIQRDPGQILSRILEEGVESGGFPGAQGCVRLRGQLIFNGCSGKTSVVGPGRPVLPKTSFDLASLTKITAAAPAVLRLIALKEISLSDRVTRFWPAFRTGGKEEISIETLLRHCSGLPAWKPFFLDVFASPLFAPALASGTAENSPARRQNRGEDGDSGAAKAAFLFGKHAVLSAVEKCPAEAPPWQKAVYSDLGFIVLGRIVELTSGMPLQDFVREEVHRPLGMSPSFRFRPLPCQRTEVEAGGEPEDIAATGLFRPREPAAGQEKLIPMPDFSGPLPLPVPGQTDDDNAFAMGGVSGHAGMFGTAEDLALFGQKILEELDGAERLGSVELWRVFCSKSPRLPGSTRALGFDTPSFEGSSAGSIMAASRAIGHLGFTGTSLWIDLDRGLSVALVTNRVHPRRGREEIKRIRPAFADAAEKLAEAWLSSKSSQ